MLEKPDLSDETLRACLRDHYGLHVTQIAFLPIGNDVDTAVYRVVADDATPYFLKLRSWARSGRFDATTVAIPRFLYDQGITPIVAPIETNARQLWARLDAFAVILFPFVTGQNGFAAPLSERQWIALGVALKAMHTAIVPPSLRSSVPQETYAPYWRDLVRAFQAQVASTPFADPVAAELAAFLRARRDEIARIVARADTLGAALRARSPAQVLCHADIHGGNVLIGTDGALSIVDWDTLIFAPKERDLMFIGGGVGGVWHGAQEEAWFYQGYGRTAIDPMALAYYRYERIVEDIAAYGEQLLLTDEGGADRAHGLHFFLDQFLPGNVVAIAYRTDQLLGESEGAP
ncbi:MAG: aminoglycoside phosphotransferase family protein [Chloroflexota bacterium]|nr:aminoglycoside phosphotransferase family protein [Chloroflexota bacterium]